MSSLSISTDITLEYDGSTFIVTSTPYSAPLTLSSTALTPVVVTCNFSANISNANHYIIVGSSNITFDGVNQPINVSGVNNYHGLIQNIIYNNIIIQNIIINSINSTLLTNSGWIGQTGFTNGIFDHCGSTGNIPNDCGGIVGSHSTNCTVSNSYSKGNIVNFAGGILGAYCVNCHAINCFSTGSISNNSGGIFGGHTNDSATSATSTAVGCYSNGLIGNVSNYSNGGIYGSYCNSSAITSTCLANNCFSVGHIYGDDSGSNGGIFGITCISSCIATNCYALGQIGVRCGGIFLSSIDCQAIDCYSVGLIERLGGGIFGFNCSGIAQRCYSIGNIGDNAGGIYGNLSVDCRANNCYTLGTLGIDSGSLFGTNSTNSSCLDCYVLFGTRTNFFGTGDSGSVITNCLTENGGTWNDVNAQSTIANANSDWFSVGLNVAYLLASFNTYGGLTPNGYQYVYIIPNLVEVISNGIQTTMFVTGYYTNQLISDIVIASQPYSSQIYGYVITTDSITIHVKNHKHHKHHKHYKHHKHITDDSPLWMQFPPQLPLIF